MSLVPGVFPALGPVLALPRALEAASAVRPPFQVHHTASRGLLSRVVPTEDGATAYPASETAHAPASLKF